MKFDFQIVLMARNEKEAAYRADLKEIDLWTEVDSNWKIIIVCIYLDTNFLNPKHSLITL